MPTWTHLLGLPLHQAEAHLRQAGAAYRIVPTIAPVRKGQPDETPVDIPLTQRVIRVKTAEDAVELVIGAFPDGDPQHP